MKTGSRRDPRDVKFAPTLHLTPGEGAFQKFPEPKSKAPSHP